MNYIVAAMVTLVLLGGLAVIGFAAIGLIDWYYDRKKEKPYNEHRRF